MTAPDAGRGRRARLPTSEPPWRGYADVAVYAEVPSGVVRLRRERLGVTAGDFPGWPGPPLHILTAHNPSGVVRAAAGNAAAEASLEAGLTRRGLRWFRAAGGDAAWRHVEASVAVCGLDRPSATALGRRYGQDAMVELTPAFRIIVDCDSGWALPSGWPIEPIGTGHPEAARAAGGRRRPRAGEA